MGATIRVNRLDIKKILPGYYIIIKNIYVLGAPNLSPSFLSI